MKNDWSWLFLDFSIYFVVFNYTIYVYINLYIYIYTNSNRQWLTLSIYTNHKGATQLQIKSPYLGFELLSLSPESSNQSTMPYKHNEIVVKLQCGFTQFSPRETCFFLFRLNAFVRAKLYTQIQIGNG